MLDRRITFGGDVIDAWIANAPKIIVPERKMTVFSIPGTSREVVKTEEAWEPYDQPYSLFLGDGSKDDLQAKAHDIAVKLNKSGIQRLYDDYDRDYFRLAYFKGPVDIEDRFTRAGKADVVFRCMAEKYLISGDVATPITTGQALRNPTAYKAKPLIKIEGSGTGTVVVGSVTMAFTGIVDYLYIDCEEQNVYRLPYENRNDKMTGSFPLLAPGDTIVTFSGGITAVTITPRWFTV